MGFNLEKNLVPFLELEEQTRQKVIETYGHPYGFQHKDIPGTDKIYSGKDIGKEPFATEKTHLLQVLTGMIAETNRRPLFLAPLIGYVSHLFDADIQYRLTIDEYLEQVNLFRQKIGIRQLSQSQVYKARRYFEKAISKASGNSRD